MEDDRAASILGYGLFGLGIGLTIFAVTYLVLMRADVAETRSAFWLVIFLAIVLVPALIGAAVGAARARTHAPPAAY